MQVLPTNADESRRLTALADLQILDTPTEALFDAFTRLAATICDTPISLMTLVDLDRQWFKSNYGLPGVTETPRAIAFCDYTIRQREIFEVGDATRDERFADNPLVTDDPHVRFYAGVPLVVGKDHAVGTICVIDREPRELSPTQRDALLELGRAIVQQLEARAALVAARDLAQERVNALSLALGLTQDAVAIASLDAPDQPTTFVYVNDAFLRLKRATAADVLGKPSTMFAGEQTDRAVVAGMRAKVKAGESCRADYVSYRLDGTPYHTSVAAHPLVDESGKTTHMVTIQRDVTEVVLRDAQLAMQNERLTTLTSIARNIFAALEPRALVDALTVGARELIDADARLLVACARGGFTETIDLVAPDDAVPLDDPLLATAAASAVPLIADDERRAIVRIAAASGEAARYLLDLRAGHPLATVDVFAIGLLAQYFAVAARNVELYGELQTRRAAVIELNQVKNDLIAMLAHDFKGPLTTIVGFADVLAEDERFDDESRKFLAMISSSAMRLASLATDTLALSRLEQNELTLNVEEFDLVALVADIVRVFSVTRRIDFSSASKRFVVAGDPARLRQVFENLIGNAIKYSPNGEPVSVEMRGEGANVEVTVTDQGIGIPEADLPKLFGRFARAQNARTLGIGGTGFGLYLTKTILEMHGGSVTVETQEGKGSSFRAIVPVSAAARPRHRRFLLVDLVGDARSYLAHTLRDQGFAATVVEDGEAAIAQIDEVQFDAALVDTERVGFPLEEFVRRVAGRAALVRIDPVQVEESPGWDGFLVKPFLTKDLLTTLDAALARHPPRKPNASLTFAEPT